MELKEQVEKIRGLIILSLEEFSASGDEGNTKRQAKIKTNSARGRITNVIFPALEKLSMNIGNQQEQIAATEEEKEIWRVLAGERGLQIAELSKAHTFCDRHNEDDIDHCPNCTIEEIDDALTQKDKRVAELEEEWSKRCADAYDEGHDKGRNETIEECAKVADTNEDGELFESNVSAAIRKLKD